MVSLVRGDFSWPDRPYVESLKPLRYSTIEIAYAVESSSFALEPMTLSNENAIEFVRVMQSRPKKSLRKLVKGKCPSWTE